MLGLIFTAMAAYSFSRFRFRGRRSLLQTILLIQVFPNFLNMVALFVETYEPTSGYGNKALGAPPVISPPPALRRRP